MKWENFEQTMWSIKEMYIFFSFFFSLIPLLLDAKINRFFYLMNSQRFCGQTESNRNNKGMHVTMPLTDVANSWLIRGDICECKWNMLPILAFASSSLQPPSFSHLTNMIRWHDATFCNLIDLFCFCVDYFCKGKQKSVID